MAETSNRNLAGAILALAYGGLSLLSLMRSDSDLGAVMPEITKAAPALAAWIGVVVLLNLGASLAMVVSGMMILLRGVGVRVIQVAALMMFLVAVAHPIIGLSLIPVGAAFGEFRTSFQNAAVGSAFVSALGMGVLLALMRVQPLRE